jgi:hypothetical protein
MNREEALTRIAWHQVKQLSREEATESIKAFFKEPLKPSLREKLNLTAIIQWETHTPPPELHPGNPIYRPVLIDRMRERFKGVANEYLAHYLRDEMGMDVERVEGKPADLLPCPACGYKTFTELGTWKTCPVCGWNSDPMQEAIPTEAIGSNGISLEEARRNFIQFGAITQKKLAEVDPEGKQKFLKQ